jgi:hypothetical protein
MSPAISSLQQLINIRVYLEYAWSIAAINKNKKVSPLFGCFKKIGCLGARWSKLNYSTLFPSHHAQHLENRCLLHNSVVSLLAASFAPVQLILP